MHANSWSGVSFEAFYIWHHSRCWHKEITSRAEIGQKMLNKLHYLAHLIDQVTKITMKLNICKIILQNELKFAFSLIKLRRVFREITDSMALEEFPFCNRCKKWNSLNWNLRKVLEVTKYEVLLLVYQILPSLLDFLLNGWINHSSQYLLCKLGGCYNIFARARPQLQINNWENALKFKNASWNNRKFKKNSWKYGKIHRNMSRLVENILEYRKRYLNSMKNCTCRMNYHNFLLCLWTLWIKTKAVETPHSTPREPKVSSFTWQLVTQEIRSI